MKPSFLLAASVLSIRLVEPVLAQTDDFVIKPEEIGRFQYGGRQLRIWESIRNQSQLANDPRLWQFRYDPIFLPETQANGTLNIKQAQLIKGYRLTLKISLYNPQSDKLADRAVRLRYAASIANCMLADNVAALKISSITLNIPDLATQVPGATLYGASQDLFTPQSSFLLAIDVPDAAKATQVKSFLPSARIDYKVSFSAKKSRQNTITVKLKDIKNSSLYVTLNGLGTNEVFVHRDDMGELAVGIK